MHAVQYGKKYEAHMDKNGVGGTIFDYHRRVETGAKFNRHVSLHQYKVRVW